MKSPLGVAERHLRPMGTGLRDEDRRSGQQPEGPMTTSSILAGLAVLATIVAVTVSTPATAQTHAQTHAVIA